MYVIKFKDKSNNDFNGEYGPCNFIKGKTETESKWFAAWFEGNGFEVKKVEEKQSTYSTMKVEELKTLCTEKGIEYSSKVTKDELIKLLEGVE